jgi:hypothetical protein
MSLDVTLTTSSEITAFDANITHNLSPMAKAARVYEVLWCPEEINLKYAKELIPLLEGGLQRLRSDPDRYKEFNPPNGWGRYEVLVSFIEGYLKACRENPTATVSASR